MFKYISNETSNEDLVLDEIVVQISYNSEEELRETIQELILDSMRSAYSDGRSDSGQFVMRKIKIVDAIVDDGKKEKELEKAQISLQKWEAAFKAATTEKGRELTALAVERAKIRVNELK